MQRNFRSLLAAAGLATGLAAASTLVLAQAASPFPSAPDDPSVSAPSASQGRQGHRGRQHGQHAGKGHDAMSHTDRQARRAAMDKLTTPEERTAFREQMRSATPEQRPELMAARRAEMEQRAKDRGVTLPVIQPGGGQGGPRDGQRGHRHGRHGGGQATTVPSPAQPAAPASM